MSFKMTVRGAPPALFKVDHRCRDCDYLWEVTTATREEHEVNEDGEAVFFVCPNCDSSCTFVTWGTATAPVTIVRGNHDFSERQNERLYKRSSEHYRKEGRDEAIELQRAQFKRDGLVSDDKIAKMS